MQEELKLKVKHWVKLVLRVLIGLFFIATAVMKLFSLDSFEVYIYSFNIFNFVLCTVVARLVIMAELLVGFLLISKILYKYVWWLTQLMLVGFTLFLVYVAVFRHDANCHCMGDLVELNPVWSIVKNLVLMALMLPLRKEGDYVFKGKVAVGIVGAVLSVAVPFALFPMDTVYNMFGKNDNQINEKEFYASMRDSATVELNLGDGDYIFGYLAAGCKYCKLSGKKLDAIVEKNNLDTSRIVFFIWGTDKSIDKYKLETGATHFRYAHIGPVEAINIVNGQFPTYVFVRDGKPVKVADVRQLEERSVVEFLQ